MEDFFLKIGKDTNHIRAGKSIEKQILQGNRVFIDVIGTAANYTATKSFIQSKSALTNVGIPIAFAPSYADLKTTDGEVKTAIRWEVIVLSK